jgi:hypothetical protein
MSTSRMPSVEMVFAVGKLLFVAYSRCLVSFQITVLKVLAGHPGGHASIADLTRYVSILISSGTDWTNRTKQLAARAPKLDIFADSFVVRDDEGWRITDAGRLFLALLEAPLQAASEVAETVETPLGNEPPPCIPPLRLVVNNEHPRSDGRDSSPSRRSA